MTKCTVENCLNKAYAKGLCNAHYIRKRRGKDMGVAVQQFNISKSCVECGSLTKGKGGMLRCARHYRALRKNDIKAKLIEKMGGKCKICNGVFHHAAFDFHHLKDKKDHISSMFNRCSEAEIIKEAEKCILLCANCHRIHHAEQL